MNSQLAFGMPQGPEWVIIFVVVLLLFGAKKIPELARGLGKSMGEFKKAKDEFEREIKSAEAEAAEDESSTKVKEASGKEARDDS